METPLQQRHCESQSATKLPPGRADELLKLLPGWEITAGELRKTFKFKNYYETLAFVNATAFISHREDHHPDIEVGYNKLTIRYSTHSVGGLTDNDFICAAKVEALLVA